MGMRQGLITLGFARHPRIFSAGPWAKTSGFKPHPQEWIR
jgi:hypothetical protein